MFQRSFSESIKGFALSSRSSSRNRKEGVQVSSNCPERTDQIKAARNAPAINTLSGISKSITLMVQDFGLIAIRPDLKPHAVVAKHPNATTLIELSGIRIAQTI